MENEEKILKEGEKNPSEENNQNAEDRVSLEEQLKEEKDRYIRLYAEFENYKKRSLKEKLEFFKYAEQDIIASMLTILDDFERAIKEMEKTTGAEDLRGIELIYQKFKNKLIEKGLQPIEVQTGDTLDVDKHEAITQIPAPKEDLKGKIVDVVETGYQLHEKVIRFAKVVTGK